MYAEDERKYSYLKYVFIAAFLIIIVLIIIFLIPATSDNFKTKRNDFEKLILKDAEIFVRENNISMNTFITLADIENYVSTKYDTCNKSTGILYNNGKYDLYVRCANYSSKTIEELNNKKYKYINLKEDAFLVTSDNTFKDPGYISNYKVEVLGQNIYSTQGLYITTYYVKDNNGNVLEQAKRYVIYSNYNNDLKSSRMELIGEKDLYLKKGTVYKELGVRLFDSQGNDLSKNVRITGAVNVNVPGVYKIDYVLNQLHLTRTVTITNMNVDATLSTTDITNKSIYIILDIDSKEYLNTTLPDDTIKVNNYIKYEVHTNGTYDFMIKDKNNNVTRITKEISNIDKIKPTATCIGKSENEVTTVSVEAKDNLGIKSYRYGMFSDEVNTNTYAINQTLNGLWVTVKDVAGNSVEVSCDINVIAPPAVSEPSTDQGAADPNGKYSLVRLTWFDDAGLAKCGTECVQKKMASGDMKLDERGWYMYKYNGEWYHVIAAAINDSYVINKYGHSSYTDIRYYNYYDTFNLYISSTSSSSLDKRPDARYKKYKVIILDVCGACLKFSTKLQDIHPPWDSETIQKWRNDAKVANSIKLDLWVSPEAETVNPGDWAFIDK